MSSVPISQLDISQLVKLKNQLEDEVKEVTHLIQIVNESVLKTQKSIEELKQFDATPADTGMFVPITESLFVRGKVAPENRPIIELGTGYFAETTVEKAHGFFERRVQKLNEKREKLRSVFKDKDNTYRIVAQVLTQKLKSVQTQQA